jgi:hypothetical protein
LVDVFAAVDGGRAPDGLLGPVVAGECSSTILAIDWWPACDMVGAPDFIASGGPH